MRSEVYAPLSLSGDVQGAVNPFDLTPGEHVLTVTRFATDADARTNRLPGQVTTIRFKLSTDPAGARLAGRAHRHRRRATAPADAGPATPATVTAVAPPAAASSARPRRRTRRHLRRSHFGHRHGTRRGPAVPQTSRQSAAAPRAKPTFVIKRAAPRGG